MPVEIYTYDNEDNLILIATVEEEKLAEFLKSLRGRYDVVVLAFDFD